MSRVLGILEHHSRVVLSLPLRFQTIRLRPVPMVRLSSTVAVRRRRADSKNKTEYVYEYVSFGDVCNRITLF